MRFFTSLVLLSLAFFSTANAQTEPPPPETSQPQTPQTETSQLETPSPETTVAQFLAALQNHPAVKAQAALVAAAQAQLDAVYAPVSFNASANYTRLNLDVPETPPGTDTPDIPKNLVGMTLGASLRPFVFGDTADLAETRRIDLEKAKLSYLETLSALEAQALSGAAQVALAEASLNLAREGADLAETALSAARTRQTKGAAGASDVRSLELQLRDAANRLQSAQTSLDLARRSLASLVGAASAPASYRLVPTSGTPPDVLRAQLDLQLAKVGAAGLERGLYPTAQASYTWPLSDNKSELSLSIESRTLQPGVNYSYANPKQGAAGFSAPEGVPASALKGSFTVGVALNISPEAFGALQAADARVTAAAAGLQAALDNAELTALSLQNALQTAQLGLELARQSVADAELTLQDVNTRRDLGLATDLEVAQAEFAATQARLGERSAELVLLQALLDTYSTYAVVLVPLPAPEAQP